jgi:iron complex transport system permease protein
MAKKTKNPVEKERLQSSIRLNIEQQDERLYAGREKARLTIGHEGTVVLVLGIILALLFLFSLLFLMDITYRTPSPAWIIENVQIRFKSLIDLMTGNHAESGSKFMLVEFASIVLSGGALAASGALYQGVFHNPMASPTLLGVQSGGTFGMTVYSLYFLAPGAVQVIEYEDVQKLIDGQTIWQRYEGQLFVFAGCLLAVIVVVGVARIAGHGKVNTVALLLGGSVFSGIISTLTNALQLTGTVYHNTSAAESAATSMMSTTFGSISSPALLAMMGIPIVVGMVLAVLMSGRINLIVFGETEAKTTGINVERDRIIIILLSTLLTSSVIAFCGQAAFIGLISAVLARRLTGPDYRWLLPASIFLGGIILLIAYDACYAVGFDVDAGSMAGILGGIIFFVMITVNRRQHNADWA